MAEDWPADSRPWMRAASSATDWAWWDQNDSSDSVCVCVTKWLCWERSVGEEDNRDERATAIVDGSRSV